MVQGMPLAELTPLAGSFFEARGRRDFAQPALRPR